MKKMLSRMTLVGLAVAITTVIGAASVSYAANGKPFILGKNNAATAVSTLVKQGPGPALRLLVRPGSPPMTVNSAVRVPNLNADKVDGKDAGAFLPKSGKAADSEKVDGFEANELSRVAFEQNSDVVLAGRNGTMASAEITAPTKGFLVISASANARNFSVSDNVACDIRVDGDSLPGSNKEVELDGGEGFNETGTCATNAVAPVGSGSHRVDFEAFGVSSASTTFQGPSLSVIFIPFDGEGNPPRQSE